MKTNAVTNGKTVNKFGLKMNQTRKPILDVISGQKPARQPFWLMRQAGRYLPEYRELRAEAGGFLDLVYNPDFAAEVTIQPIRRFDMDAAILFSDILVIPHALGQTVEFVKGEGPKLDPIRNTEGLKALEGHAIHETLGPIYQTIRNVRSGLTSEGFDHTTLIGFAGAPWTVACYMVDGGGSKDFMETKRWAYSDPDGFQKLMDILVTSTADYLTEQVKAGAEVIKIFDSWAGIVDEAFFKSYVIKPAKQIVDIVRQNLSGTEFEGTPIIGFARGAGVQHKDYAQQTGIDVIAVDQMVPAHWVRDNLQPLKTVQGNLDPFSILAGGDAMVKSATHVLETLGGSPFIFNMGHGINKDTPPDHVALLAKTIHDFKL